MYEEKLKKFLNENYGYITTKEIEKLGIKRNLIPKFIDSGILKKVAYGIYKDKNIIEDEYFLLQKRFSNVIFSYNTACYFQNLSDRNPYTIDITTVSHNNINEDLNIHYIAKDKLEIGSIDFISPYGNPIKIYNAERCICDILKNPLSVDIELYGKIIKNYFNQKNKDLIVLEKYAKIFNIYKKLENIMEVLL